jgi:hypothetical protein
MKAGLVICTTEFSTCLNIVLRDKGLGEEEGLLLWEHKILEFCCCCCATAVDEVFHWMELLSLLPSQIPWLLLMKIVFSLVYARNQSSNLFLLIKYTGFGNLNCTIAIQMVLSYQLAIHLHLLFIKS